MPSPAQGLRSTKRLAALQALGLLDSPTEARFDRVTRLAAEIVGAPICLISLVDDHRQFFKSAVGLGGAAGAARETPLSHSFCQHVVDSGAPLVVNDAHSHPQVCHNLAIKDLGVIAYLGVPIRSADGYVLGSFCVIDTKPRSWQPIDQERLTELVALVETEITLRAALSENARIMSRQRALLDGTNFSVIATNPEGLIEEFNNGAERMLGYRAEEMVGIQTPTVIHVGQEVVARAAELSTAMGVTIAPGFEVFVAKARENQVEERAWTYVRKDGSHVPVILSVTALRNPSGEITGFLGIARDNSERQRTIETLANLAELQQRTNEMAKVGGWELALVTMELTWSLETCRIHEIDPPVAPTLASAINFCAPEARPVFEAAVKTCITKGTPWDLELPLITAKGQRIWARAQGRAVLQNGKAVKLVGAYQDITERKRTERILQNTVERFRRLGSQVPGMIYQFRQRLDGSSCFPYSSEGIREIYRTTPEAVREDASAVFSVIHPDDLAATAESIQASARTLKPWQYEYRVRFPDGVVRWLHGNAVPEQEADGSLLWHGFITDVTERKLKDAQIILGAERLRLAAETAGVAVWEWDLVTDKIHWDTNLFKIYGVEPTETGVVGFQTWSAAVHPDDLDGMLVDLKALVAGGGRLEREFRIVRQPDRAVRFIQGAQIMVGDGTGKSTRMVGINFDITQRKNEQAAIKLSEARFRTLTQNAPAGIFETDVRGGCTFVNEQWSLLAGRTSEEAAGNGWSEALHPEDRGAIFAEWAAFSQGERPFQMEYRFLHRDGRVVWVAGNAVAIRESNGTLKGYLGTVSDITARKQLESNLAHARDQALEGSRLKSEFLATMSHEIRTPMNAVIGMAGLLVETDLQPDQAEMARTIAGGAETLLSIINDILDFSRIEAGRMRLDAADFDFRRIVEETVTLLAARAHEKHVELTCEFTSPPETLLLGDGGRVRQVLTNLIGNAIKFTDAGEVAVQVRTIANRGGRSRLRVDVRDTGVGIPAEAQARLFQPFTQADGSATRRFGGTGLGLAISRQLVELMGGDIGFESEQGRGSVFWFELEFTCRPVAPVLPVLSVPAGTQVLVVDDNETNRRILLGQLAHWGIQAEAVPDASSALSCLRNPQAGPWHLVLLDWHMPKIDGLELAMEIRADPTLSELPLIMLSSAGPLVDIGTATAAGFAAFLTKPVTAHQLSRCITRVLAEISTAALTRSPAHRSSELPPKQRLRVLLAEDNPANQRVAAMLLSKMGHTVEVVANGRLALEKLATQAFDVVLMDCQMPVLDGYSASRQIRAGSTPGVNTQIPIIALTAYARVEDRTRCLEAGMNDYITKPIRPLELRHALERFGPIKTSRVAVAAHTNQPSSENIFDEEAFESVQSLPGTEGPSLVRELVGIYLNEETQRLDLLNTLADTRRGEQLADEAHSFGGNAASFGGSQVRRIALKLEETARAGKWPDAQVQLNHLRAACARLRQEIKRRHIAPA